MSKFDRVLSDACCMDILAKIDGFSATSDGEVYVGSGDDVWFQLAEFAERVEQAAIAKHKEKLAEQEPSAFYIHDNKATDAYYTDHAPEAQEWVSKGVGVTALYAHPCVTPMSDKPACVSEIAESETQVSSQVNLDSSNHIPDAGEKVNLSLSVDTKETQKLLQSYLDGLKDWQLVPKEPAEAMLSQGESEWTSRYEANRVYHAMLAAAPKYTGENT